MQDLDPVRQKRGSLSRLTAEGIFWSGWAELLANGIRFVTIAVLAHFLTPKDFGIVGITYVFLDFMLDIGDLGIGPAIVQRQNTTRELLDTCFWLILTTSLLLAGVLCAGAPFVALFFNESQLTAVLIVSSLIVPVRAAGMIQRTLLQKELAFRSIAIAETSGSSIFAIISIVLAVKGFGVWSIVFGLLAHRVVTVILLWSLSAWRPSLAIKLQSVKQVANFSWNVLGERIVYFVSSRADYLIIGKLLGSSALGFYTLAWEMTSAPQKRIASLVSRVAFPVFSKIQTDKSMIKVGYLKLIRNVALITTPILALLLVVSADFVAIVFGEKWLPSAYPLSILCGASIVRCLMNSSGSVFYSKGRADIAFKWGLAQLVMIVPIVLFGARFGIIGVAAAVSIAYVFFFLINQLIVNRLVDISFRAYVVNLRHIIIASTGMATLVALLRLYLKASTAWSDLASLAVLLTLGIVVYFAILVGVRRDVVPEVKRIAVHMMSSSRS